MTRAGRRFWHAGLVGLPLIALALWFASDCENLTKSTKNIQVEVDGGLFGGTITETRQVPGPILGYYIGLYDAVAPVAVGALLLGVIPAWLRRRAARSK